MKMRTWRAYFYLEYDAEDPMEIAEKLAGQYPLYGGVPVAPLSGLKFGSFTAPPDPKEIEEHSRLRDDTTDKLKSFHDCLMDFWSLSEEQQHATMEVLQKIVHRLMTDFGPAEKPYEQEPPDHAS